LSAIRLSLIAAVAENGVIGAGAGMPWRLSSDLKRFKVVTMGKPVIMGRKTFETIGKALPGRPNIVVSRRPGFAPEGVTVTPTLDAALVAAEASAKASGDEEMMVIGGGEIYRAAIDRADRLYITHVEASPEGDTHFPSIDPAMWQATTAERLPAGPKDSAASTFVVYERIGQPVSP
jgi:dihydrofolate reductase